MAVEGGMKCVKFLLFIFNFLFWFAVLLTLIFLVEIAAAIAGYIFKDKVKDVFSTAMEDSMKKYNQSADFKKAVDTIQTDLLGIVFACVLMKAIRSGYEVM
ncbi:UNVERIFIED_CONTAM: hypothetical protein FKN15_060272 [Acipenser sinensis]